MACGPAEPATCRSPGKSAVTEYCDSGCYCPEGTVLHEDRCIPKTQCPCTLHTKTYAPGEQVPNECNTWYESIGGININYL